MRIVRITGYTCAVERQLKERLIGAAVLVAIAVLLVPEMFSGPRSRAPQPVELDSRAGTSEAATEQIKTMQIDLQRAPVSAARSSEAVSSAAPVTIEPPAAAPKSDIPEPVAAAPVPAAASSRSAESSAASRASNVTSTVINQAASSQAASKSSQSASKSSVSSRAASSAASVAPPPPKPAATSAGNWQVQIGSFGTEARAREIAAQLKSQGHSVSVSPLKAGGKTLFRVRVAGGSTQESAQAVLKKLSATYSGAAVVPPGK